MKQEIRTRSRAYHGVAGLLALFVAIAMFHIFTRVVEDASIAAIGACLALLFLLVIVHRFGRVLTWHTVQH